MQKPPLHRKKANPRLNCLFWGGLNLMQMSGSFRGFPLYILVRCLGWSNNNDQWRSCAYSDGNGRTFRIGWNMIWDEILPRYIGIIINHHKDPS